MVTKVGAGGGRPQGALGASSHRATPDRPCAADSARISTRRWSTGPGMTTALAAVRKPSGLEIGRVADQQDMAWPAAAGRLAGPLDQRGAQPAAAPGRHRPRRGRAAPPAPRRSGSATCRTQPTRAPSQRRRRKVEQRVRCPRAAARPPWRSARGRRRARSAHRRQAHLAPVRGPGAAGLRLGRRTLRS